MDVLRSAVSLLAHWDPEAADGSHDANVRKTERLLAQIPFVVMIPKNAGVRDFMSCEQFGVFVDSSLRIGTGVAIDLVTT